MVVFFLFLALKWSYSALAQSNPIRAALVTATLLRLVHQKCLPEPLPESKYLLLSYISRENSGIRKLKMVHRGAITVVLRRAVMIVEYSETGLSPHDIKIKICKERKYPLEIIWPPIYPYTLRNFADEMISRLFVCLLKFK